jgi:hypothetical protein
MRPDYSLLPPHTAENMRLYLEEGVPPGADSFLEAVLADELVHSFAYADERNLAAMPQIARFLYDCVPTIARGSKEAIASWCERIAKLKAGEEVTT